MNILVFDNYDSFTYNLVQIIEQITGVYPDVVRNDKITLEEVNRYDKIILSPGPGLPLESGILMELIKHYAPTKDILGVCLGHQAIGQSFGANLYNMKEVMHGWSVPTQVIYPDILFSGIPEVFSTGRYHSWAIAKEDFPEDLVITALDDKGVIMALRHRIYKVRGVQFHPESILTEYGTELIKNWLDA